MKKIVDSDKELSKSSPKTKDSSKKKKAAKNGNDEEQSDDDEGTPERNVKNPDLKTKRVIKE